MNSWCTCVDCHDLRKCLQSWHWPIKSRKSKSRCILNCGLTIIFPLYLGRKGTAMSVNGNPNCSIDLSFRLSWWRRRHTLSCYFHILTIPSLLCGSMNLTQSVKPHWDTLTSFNWCFYSVATWLKQFRSIRNNYNTDKICGNNVKVGGQKRDRQSFFIHRKDRWNLREWGKEGSSVAKGGPGARDPPF